MNTVPLEQLSFETFSKWVKTAFRVWVAPNDPVELELVEVTPPRVLSAGGADNRRYENFSVVFLGPADRSLAQRIYTFESEGIGRFDLFIVPVGREPRGFHYQATFNRLIKSG